MTFEEQLKVMALAPSYWYLASPYSKYSEANGGMKGAFEEVCRAAAWLLERGVRTYCPIAHTHPIAEHGRMDKACHATWLPLDELFMPNAAGIIVCMMPGWKESYGVDFEIKAFEKAGKPIVYMEWPIKKEFVVTGFSRNEVRDALIQAVDQCNFRPKTENTEPAKALRNNKGKPCIGEVLCFSHALFALARVLEQGGKEYSYRNWLKGGKPDSEYIDSASRHLVAFQSGKEYDEKTGCLHLAHAVWNLLALIRLNRTEAATEVQPNRIDGTL